MNLFVKNTITINASANKVWDALVNPEQTKKYMFGCETVSDWKVGSELLWKGNYEGKEMIFVKGHIINIEPSVNEVLLESIFKQYGDVKETKIIYDKITWESRGFGFVEFTKKEDAIKAIEGLNGKELIGKKLSVEEAVEKR